MRCPKCANLEDKVLDSRSVRSGAVIRRRRMCLSCGHRFTTYEEVIKASLRVVKRDNRHEDLDRSKLRGGILTACEKRPVSIEQIDGLVERIIDELESEYEREVPSQAIGERVMNHLEKMDEVAFVRFASVYRRFKDIQQFMNEIEGMMGRP